jgi:diguanylate cyclase (GGDEF)-like protein
LPARAERGCGLIESIRGAAACKGGEHRSSKGAAVIGEAGFLTSLTKVGEALPEVERDDRFPRGRVAVIEQGKWHRLGLSALAGAGAFLLGMAAAAEDIALVALMGGLAVGLPAVLVRSPGRRTARDAASSHDQSSPPSRRDALTGLASRAVVVDQLHTLLSSERRSDRMVALLLVDLVDFGGVNRELGHAAGDLLLRHAGARLHGSLREGDLLARLDGDRFAIVLKEVARPADAAGIGDRLLESFREPFDLHGALWRPGVRIGVALAGEDARRTPEQLIEEAVGAVARAKADRCDELRFADTIIDADVREQRQLERDLAGALERGELELLYQPQVDLASCQMVGVEAIVCWSHPDRGCVSADRLVPMAENSGLIRSIGPWMLEQACGRAAHWQRMGVDLRVAIDVSPAQLRDAGFVDVVMAILAETGLAPERLELEISDRLSAEATREHLVTLEHLKKLGIRLALDGFAAVASLRPLCTLPLDTIKLDRDLVGALGLDPAASAIVRAGLGLGRSLGLVAIAEGVESADQLSLLVEEGCGVAQGSHFSPAVHPSDIEAAIEGPHLPYSGDVDNEENSLTA